VKKGDGFSIIQGIAEGVPDTYIDVTGHPSRYPSTAGLPDDLLRFLPQAMLDEQRARHERIRKIQQGRA
jgi:hypothetical protein